MGSRVRIAAAACVVASGLLAGGASATMAFADPLLTSGDSGDKHTNDSLGNGSDKPKSDPDEKRTTPGVGPRPGGTGSEHSGNVGSGKEEKPGADSEEHKPGGNKPDENEGEQKPGDGGEDRQDPNDPGGKPTDEKPAANDGEDAAANDGDAAANDGEDAAANDGDAAANDGDAAAND